MSPEELEDPELWLFIERVRLIFAPIVSIDRKSEHATLY